MKETLRAKLSECVHKAGDNLCNLICIYTPEGPPYDDERSTSRNIICTFSELPDDPDLLCMAFSPQYIYIKKVWLNYDTYHSRFKAIPRTIETIQGWVPTL